MSKNIVEIPYDYYPNFNKDGPLYNGKIFIGKVNTDPEIIANQKPVTYQDSCDCVVETPIIQPIRTSSGGVPIYNNSPVRLFVEGSYSMKVLDKGGNLIYYVPDTTNGVPVTVDQLDAAINDTIISLTLAEYKDASSEFKVGAIIYIKDRAAKFEVINGTGTANDLNIIASTSVNQSISMIRDNIKLSQHGIVGNEVDVVSKITTLLNQARSIFIPVLFDVELLISSSIIIGGEFQDIQILENITTTSEDPVLEIKCSRSKVRGVSKGNTTLLSPYSPNGVIHIDDEFASSIAYNDIGSFNIESTLQTSVGGSKGLVMRSLDGYVQFTYFNNIHDLKFTSCDTAVFLAGNINANFFSNIFMVNCGNNKTFSDSAGFFLTEAETTDNTPAGGGSTKFEGPLENQISRVFHTGSTDATSLFFSGKVYNNLISWSCETGGSLATSFKTVNSGFAYGNIVTMTSIAFSGPDIDPVYFTISSFNDGGNANILKVTSPNIKATNDLKVGNTTGSDISIDGMFIGAETGTNHLTRDGATSILLNRLTNTGKIIDLRVNGALGGEIGVGGGDRLFLGSTAGSIVSFLPDTIIPVDTNQAAKDNLIDLGSGFARFREIFAGNGIINTSDERLKKFSDIEQVEKDVALTIKASIRKFVWNDSVNREVEGGKSARIHFGVGAQFVSKAFKDAGLNPDDYSLFCYDEWESEHITEPATFNNEGKEVTPEYIRVTRDAGNRYGIRYSELSMFILSAI